MKRVLLLFLTFFAIDIILYWGLWNTFFQQDEWFILGRTIYQLQHLPFSLFGFESTHFWPLGTVYWIIAYRLFGLSASVHAWFALIAHSIAVLLVFYFIKLLIKNKKASFVLSLLLLVSFPTRQIVVWYAVSFALPYSVIFLLLFMIILMKEKGVLSAKKILVLFLFFVISLFFREEAVLLFILAPLYILLFWKREQILLNKKNFIVLFSLVAVITAARFILQKFIGDTIQFEHDKNSVMTAYNILTVPFKMVVQNVIEYDQLVNYARIYTRLSNPRLLPEGLIIVTSIFELLTFILIIPFIFLLGFAISRLKRYDLKVLLYGLIIIVAYSFLLSPQTRRLITLESRYLFVGAIGVLICFYSTYKALITVKLRHFAAIVRTFSYALMFIFVAYSYVHIRYVLTQNYLPTSKMRQEILNQIISLHPSIPSHTVFYIDCKIESDCIANPLVLPFQSGVGQMLMVIYARQDEKGYAPFFKDFYLWDWEAQGYKEIGDIGFGYYRQEEALLKDYKKEKLKTARIIALRYSRKENKITEITPIVRKMLEDSVKSR